MPRFGDAPVSNLAIAELALQDAEDLFDLYGQQVPRLRHRHLGKKSVPLRLLLLPGELQRRKTQLRHLEPQVGPIIMTQTNGWSEVP